MVGLEVVVGFLVAWFARKAGRVGRRLDGMADEVLDAGLARLHEVVASKLSGEPALEKLAAEAGESGEAGPRSEARVRLALEDAVEEDPAFAAELDAAVARVREAGGVVGATTGDHGVAVTGGVHADRGGVAIGGVTGGSVAVESRQDPSGPDRSRG
jgi:hypothetical protein